MQRGSFSDRSRDKKDPYILLENRVKYMDDLDVELNITRNAANKRRKAILQRIDRALKQRAKETQARANLKAA